MDIAGLQIELVQRIPRPMIKRRRKKGKEKETPSQVICSRLIRLAKRLIDQRGEGWAGLM